MKSFLEKKHILVLALIIFFGILIRLQNFNLPPIDAHPMRQTDTECVAYHFAYKDANILHPQACLIRPLTNREGYFFLEFPMYQYILGNLYKVFGNGIAVARVYNLGLYVISVLCLYYFVKNLYRFKEAIIATFLFSFAPGSIFFIGHAIHPDVFAITTLLASLASYTYFSKNNKLAWFAIALILLSLSVATRPFILLVMPAFLYLMFRHKARIWQYFCLVICAPLIYFFWRLFQLQYESADASWENWILTGRDMLLTYAGLVERLILKNVVGEIVGKIIFLFAGLSVIKLFTPSRNQLIFPLLWLAGVPIYWLVVPNGNMIHQYYANVFLLPIIILASFGVSTVLNLFKNNYLRYSFIFLMVVAVVYNGHRVSSYYFADIESSDHQAIARDIEKHVPERGKIVYLGSLNSVPMSMAHRQGWMLGDVQSNARDVMFMKKYGAEYVVAGYNNTDLNRLEMDIIEEKLKIYKKTKWVTIYRL